MLVSSAYGAAALMSLLSFGGAVAFVAAGAAASALGLEKSAATGFFDATCLVLAAAAMVGDACLHLIPETFAGATEADADRYGLFLVAGCLAVLVFEAVCASVSSSVEPFGVANLLVEGLHNFADGMALGVAWTLGPEAGFATTVAVAVHELPQELGDFAVLRRAGFSTGPLLLANFLASLTCFGGVALAGAPFVASRENELVAFTAGSFLALALHSLAPQALATLEGFEGKGAKAAHAAWMVCLVAFIVKFLLFVGELEESAHGGEL